MSTIPEIVIQNRKRYNELEVGSTKQWRQAYCCERNWIHEQLWPAMKSGHRYFDDMLFVAETQKRVSEMLDEISG